MLVKCKCDECGLDLQSQKDIGIDLGKIEVNNSRDSVFIKVVCPNCTKEFEITISLVVVMIQKRIAQQLF